MKAKFDDTSYIWGKKWEIKISVKTPSLSWIILRKLEEGALVFNSSLRSDAQNHLLKNYCSHAHFWLKTSVLWITQCSHAHIWSKNVLSHKNTSHLFQILNERPPAVIPIYGRKTSILRKLHYCMAQKSQ